MEPLFVDENMFVTITEEDQEVEGGDHYYPENFMQSDLEGDNYTLDEFTIMPDQNFTGTLSIPLKASDGIEESEVFLAPIEV